LQRVLSTAVLVGLLIATAAAFAITERLKLVKSPIYGTFVSKRISPTCGCARGKATISVKLRRGDDVTVTIRDGRGAVVDTLAAGEYVPPGRAVFAWDGRTDVGKRARDGSYRPEIHFARQHRTILLPNRIVLDTHPPKVLDAGVSRSTISPDGNDVGDTIKVSYRFNSPAHAALYLHSHRLLRTRSHQAQGKFTWLGKVDGAPLKAGTYTLYLGGIDLAGNVTPAKARRPLVVVVRYIRLTRHVIRLKKPGVRFGVGVETDASTYRWQLHGKRGLSKGPVLYLHAPTKPGTYRLLVGEQRYTDTAKLIVGRRR
jgi:FlgD Ig-like domain